MLARREFSRAELKGRLQKALRDDARKQRSANPDSASSATSQRQNVRVGRRPLGLEASVAASSDGPASFHCTTVARTGTAIRERALPEGPFLDSAVGDAAVGSDAHQASVAGSVEFVAEPEQLDGSVPEEALGGHDDSTIIGAVLDALEAVGSLSDERFVSSFISSRVRRGKGPVLIRAELRDRGVDEALVDRFLTFSDAYWVDKARLAKNKRFGDAPAEDAAERNRQARFLARRGFASELIRRVVMDR